MKQLEEGSNSQVSDLSPLIFYFLSLSEVHTYDLCYTLVVIQQIVVLLTDGNSNSFDALQYEVNRMKRNIDGMYGVQILRNSVKWY